jgi:hypothetical protein
MLCGGLTSLSDVKRCAIWKLQDGFERTGRPMPRLVQGSAPTREDSYSNVPDVVPAAPSQRMSGLPTLPAIQPLPSLQDPAEDIY